MRLSWRDGLATLFVVAGLALAWSVVQGWDWPLMNGVRAGIIGLGLAGMIACSVSGWADEGPALYRSPFFIAAAIVGTFLLGIAIVGLFAGTMVFLQWMMAAFAAIWLITVVHRMLPARQREARPTPA